jgi:putative FmdB family regulatory protein
LLIRTPGRTNDMPLYEYQCVKCATRSEVLQKFSDPPLTVCPECGGELKKLISSPAIQFKGSGFYITDYARNSSSGNGSKSEPAAAPAKTETTPATGSKDSGSSSKSD